MNAQRISMFAIGLVAAGAIAADQPWLQLPQEPADPGHVQGEVVVKFAEVPDVASTEAVTRQFAAITSWRALRHAPHYKGQPGVPHPLAYYRIAEFDPALDEEALAQQINALPEIVSAEPNLYAPMAHVPNDPRYNDQYGPQIIGCEDAWDLTMGDANVVLAVADTGIYFEHEDLEDGIWLNVDDPVNGVDDDNNGFIDDWRGWDFYYDDNDPRDGNSHGTHVAGTAAGRTDNSKGIAGLAQVQIMPLQIWNENGSSDGTFVGYAEAVTYAADNGAVTTNISGGRTGGAQILADAVAYSWDNGCNVVAAAHNYGSQTKIYPAAYPEVIAVVATDSNDIRASWSNYGDWVEVAAPGVNVLSSVLGSPSSYQYYSGTSMASPHVAGLVALMRSLEPNLTTQDVRDLLQANAKDLGDPGFDIYYGWGRIDAAATLNAIQPGSCLALSFDQLVAGRDTEFTISRGERGQKAVLVYGFDEGSTDVDNVAGFCATFGIEGVTQSRVIGGFNRFFDVNGEISIVKYIPMPAQGLTVHFQAAMHGTCPEECVSNVVSGVVQ